MAFVDNLAFGLFAISFTGFLLLYTVTSMYFVYRSKKGDYDTHLAASSVPMGLAGAYLVLAGFVGQMVWPLPGSYNILFFDPMVAFGLVALAFCLAIRYKVSLENAGFLGLMVGVMTVLYGITGYHIGLTQEPIALLALYMFYGIGGILAYPVSMIADRLPGLKKNPWVGWHVILALFWVSMFAASALAAYIGYSAIGGHLLSAP